MSRTHLLLFVLLPGIVAVAQTASDLSTRYGNPDVERFRVRPGVTLMARYAEDRTACEMLIEPRRSIIPNDEPAKYMRPEVMTEIIDEVLPEADRGPLLLHFVTKSGCNDFETGDYENVTIYRFRHRCLLPNPEIEGAARITRKTPPCGTTKVNSPSSPEP
jgi:hypothetical protein